MVKLMTRTEIEEFFARLKKHNPAPKTELQYTNPYTLLVAVALSRRPPTSPSTRRRSPCSRAWTRPRKWWRWAKKKLAGAIKTIGLYRGKARNVIALSKLLIEKHGSQVPKDREALEELPGVGRKTANVVLNVAFGEPTIAVDTHIFRVSNRTGLAPGKNVLEVERGLEKRVPERYLIHAHHWLILHGRYTCVARKPLCPTCVVRDLCHFPNKTKEAPLEKPRLKIKKASARR